MSNLPSKPAQGLWAEDEGGIERWTVMDTSRLWIRQDQEGRQKGYLLLPVLVVKAVKRVSKDVVASPELGHASTSLVF